MASKMNNDEEIRQRNKDSYQRAALFWIDLANQRLSSFNKQLLTIAAILLPLTASLVAANFIDLRDFEKALLIIVWISLGFSLVGGVVQIIIDANYFKYLSRDSSRREEIWSGNDTNEEMTKQTKLLGKTEPTSTHIPLWLQAFTLGQGLLLILVIAISLLLRK